MPTRVHACQGQSEFVSRSGSGHVAVNIIPITNSISHIQQNTVK